MHTNKLNILMCSVGLAVAGGFFSSHALAHDAMKSDSGKMMMGDHKMMSDDMMMMADTNHDGMISKAEMIAHSTMMFDQMDTNHDGMVSKAEMMAGHKMMHDKMMSKDGKEDMMDARKEHMEDMKDMKDMKDKHDDKMEDKK